MSRSLQRSVTKAIKRKEAALEQFAIERYGENVQLADLHPDIKMLIELFFTIRASHKFGDTVAVDNGMCALDRFFEKYEIQGKEILTVDEVSVNPSV